MSWCSLPNSYFTYLKQLQSLKHLPLFDCSNYTQLTILDGMLLEFFDLRTSKDEKFKQVVPQFPVLPNLATLVLDVDQIDDSWIRNLPVFPKVDTLRIGNSEITNKSLKNFAMQFPSLTDLNLESCPLITEVTRCLPNLLYLKLKMNVQSPFYRKRCCIAYGEWQEVY